MNLCRLYVVFALVFDKFDEYMASEDVSKSEFILKQMLLEFDNFLLLVKQ